MLVQWMAGMGLVLLGGTALADSARLSAAMLSGEAGLQQVELTRLLGLRLAHLPHTVRIPAIYLSHRHSGDTSGTITWASRLDLSRSRRGRALSGLTGAFVARRSAQVTYSASEDLFRDERGLTERNMRERFERREASAIRIERIDRGGLPMLLVEADLSPVERLRAIYIAIPQGGTRMLYYLPQRPYGQVDDLVWSRLREDILALPGAGTTMPEPVAAASQ
jgi:hypothetical protein